MRFCVSASIPLLGFRLLACFSVTLPTLHHHCAHKLILSWLQFSFLLCVYVFVFFLFVCLSSLNIYLYTFRAPSFFLPLAKVSFLSLLLIMLQAPGYTITTFILLFFCLQYAWERNGGGGRAGREWLGITFRLSLSRFSLTAYSKRVSAALATLSLCCCFFVCFVIWMFALRAATLRLRACRPLDHRTGAKATHKRRWFRSAPNR